MPSSENLGRLVWQTRRGALELDILLSNYLRDCYVIRSRELQRAFRLLLREDDNSLMNWLVRRRQPRSELIEIVEDIVQYARGRASFAARKIKKT